MLKDTLHLATFKVYCEKYKILHSVCNNAIEECVETLNTLRNIEDRLKITLEYDTVILTEEEQDTIEKGLISFNKKEN